MIVEKVSATVRYSQDTGKGAWKVIELGAEASVGDREHWKQAQSELYHQLGDQLRSLWAGNRSTNVASTAVNGQNSAETATEPSPAPEPTQSTRLHWCQAHDTEFKRRTKNGTVWYSHREGKSWCNEST